MTQIVCYFLFSDWIIKSFVLSFFPPVILLVEVGLLFNQICPRHLRGFVGTKNRVPLALTQRWYLEDEEGTCNPLITIPLFPFKVNLCLEKDKYNRNNCRHNSYNG